VYYVLGKSVKKTDSGWETSLTARSAVYFTIRIFCDMFDEDSLGNGNEDELFGQGTQLKLALEVAHPLQNIT
jgi:hypothetical protein